MRLFSLLEIIVVVALMAMLTSFVVLHLSSRTGGYETTVEAGRGLSLYLKSVIQKSHQTGLAHSLTIDCAKGFLSIEPSDGHLSQWRCPSAINLVSVTGIEGYFLDSGADTIDIRPEGLEQSLQFLLVGSDLKEVTVTWKLGGLLCDVDTDNTPQWRIEVERF